MMWTKLPDTEVQSWLFTAMQNLIRAKLPTDELQFSC